MVMSCIILVCKNTKSARFRKVPFVPIPFINPSSGRKGMGIVILFVTLQHETNNRVSIMKGLHLLTTTALAAALSLGAQAQTLKLNDLGYFEARGTNVLVYNNLYNGAFYDEKFAGLEIIQRGERISTGGGIRLMNTPEQWDIFGVVSPRRIDRSENSVEVTLTYEDYGFAPRLKVLPKDKGVLVQILSLIHI